MHRCHVLTCLFNQSLCAEQVLTCKTKIVNHWYMSVKTSFKEVSSLLLPMLLSKLVVLALGQFCQLKLFAASLYNSFRFSCLFMLYHVFWLLGITKTNV